MFAPPAHAGLTFTNTIHNDTYDYISPTHANLHGKSVFITGASRGIGKQTALSYALAGCTSIALGARSSLSSLEPELAAAASSAGHPAPKIISLILDVSDPSSVSNAAETIKSEFGSLDILINNAGYLEPLTPIVESDPLEWWKTWNVNVKGIYLMTRAFIPLLLSYPDGLKTILNVSSVAAHMTQNGYSAYQTTKLAVLRLSEFTMVEYADQGLLVLVIHPGGVATDLATKMPENMHDVLHDQPTLAADTIVWLTKERRDWLAARYVSVAWDMQQLESKRAEIEKKDLLKVRMDIGLE